MQQTLQQIYNLPASKFRRRNRIYVGKSILSCASFMRIPLASDVSVQAAGRGARTPHLPVTPRSCCATLYRADRLCLIYDSQTAPVGIKLGLARPIRVRICQQYPRHRRSEVSHLQVGSAALCSSFKPAGPWFYASFLHTTASPSISSSCLTNHCHHCASGVCSGIWV